MSFISVKDTTLQRDLHSRGLVETDRSKADDYKARRKMLNATKETKDELNSLREKVAEIDVIKDDVREIKELLKSLVKA